MVNLSPPLPPANDLAILYVRNPRQVSKGRDTGVSQVTGFTAKISMGNGMQVRGAWLLVLVFVVCRQQLVHVYN